MAPPARAFFAQLDVEIACTLGDVDRAFRALERADAEGLGDLAWLDHCPVLAPLRGRPELARVRDRIAAKASRACS